MTYKVERKNVAIGYYIAIIESEAGWGAKVDGYLVGVSKEALDARKSVFEKGNTPNYGLYYERTSRGYQQVDLTEEAVKALEDSDTGCVYFSGTKQFIKG